MIPIQLHGVDGRYATALFSAAAKKSSLDAVEQDLKKLAADLQKNQKLLQFLESPIAGKQDKLAGINSLLKKQKYNDAVVNLFQLLAENGRLGQTSKIISAYDQLLRAHRGEVTVTVTSAQELDARALKQLTASIQKSNLVAKNAKITIETKIDAQILGGLVVEVGDKTVDLSVSSKINKLNRLLTEAI